jgi:hypothetical protein
MAPNVNASHVLCKCIDKDVIAFDETPSVALITDCGKCQCITLSLQSASTERSSPEQVQRKERRGLTREVNQNELLKSR